ncbi:MAG: hypothetical protein J5I90_05775 [Caldilineales bacterium]|nr:hypothetical protein [Caldilineales bacterium]
MNEFESIAYEDAVVLSADASPATVEAEPVNAVTPAEPPASASPKPARRRLPVIFWALVGLLIFLVIGGIASVGYYVLLTQSPTVSGDTPWDELQSENIAAGVAVWSLANTTPQQVYRQAMSAAAVETATAEALTTTELPEAERLGWLTVLARRQALAGDVEQAQSLYQLAVDLAILKPNLGDRARANALLDAAEGFAALSDADSAKKALDQVTLIGQYSTELSSAVRHQLAERVASVFESMGDLDAARAARAATPLGSSVVPDIYPDPIADIDAEGELVYPPRVVIAETNRQNQAQLFAENWINRGGEASQNQSVALENALIDEDLIRSAYYTSLVSDPALLSGDKARILWDRVQWLAIKNRAASGFYGMNLVSNWTAEQPAIRQTLHDAFMELNEALLAWIAELPENQQQPATYNLYRDALMWARTGLYPDTDEVFLANAMNDALTQWGTAAGLQPVASIGDDGDLAFELQWLGG